MKCYWSDWKHALVMGNRTEGSDQWINNYKSMTCEDSAADWFSYWFQSFSQKHLPPLLIWSLINSSPAPLSPDDEQTAPGAVHGWRSHLGGFSVVIFAVQTGGDRETIHQEVVTKKQRRTRHKVWRTNLTHFLLLRMTDR